VMLGPPDVKGTSLELTGIGMVTTIADSKILIQKNVFAKKDLVNGRKMNIKSQSALFNSQNKEAQFLGQVVLNVDQMNLEGPEVFFDYGGGDEWLKSLRVKGGVRLRYEDKTARSEGLVYETADDKLLLTGHPVVKQNEDELFGEQILLLEGGNKVKVIKPKMKLKEDSYK
jgi:lipopolysaccharide transport protein LptA